jgi:hypothetical protein
MSWFSFSILWGVYSFHYVYALALFGIVWCCSINLESQHLWTHVSFTELTLVCPTSKYSRVRKSTLGIEGGGDRIAVIRASGSITRTRGRLSVGSSGIVAEQFIEKIRTVRGIYDVLCQQSIGISFANLFLRFCIDWVEFLTLIWSPSILIAVSKNFF